MSNEMQSIEAVRQKYSTDGVHLLLPTVHLEQITPFYKLSVVFVEADLAPNSGDLFKIGSTPKKDDKGNEVKQNDKTVFESLFSPAKPLLMKIAMAAGIQFDPDYTGVSSEGKYLYVGKARGAIRLPDGSFRTQFDEKVIDLATEEEKQELLLTDKAAAGLTGMDAWNASKMYSGSWENRKIENEDKKVFMIGEKDRAQYINRQLLINMIQLRKDAPQKALTGAMLRVVRALIGLKGQYTETELKKPFVLARVNFSPDFNDPAVRKAVLEQGISAMSNLFGGRAVPSSRYLDEPIEAGYDAMNDSGDPYDNVSDMPGQAEPASPEAPVPPVPPASVSDAPVPQEKKAPKPSKAETSGKNQEVKKPEPPKQEPSQPDGDSPAANTCTKCKKTNLSDSVVRYSREHFGKVLCFTCGKEEERKTKGNAA